MSLIKKENSRLPRIQEAEKDDFQPEEPLKRFPKLKNHMLSILENRKNVFDLIQINRQNFQRSVQQMASFQPTPKNLKPSLKRRDENSYHSSVEVS